MARHRKHFDDAPIDPALLEELVNAEEFEEMEFWISGVEVPGLSHNAGEDDGDYDPFCDDDNLPF